MKHCPYCGGRTIELRMFSIKCSEKMEVEREVITREVICRHCRSEIKVKKKG